MSDTAAMINMMTRPRRSAILIISSNINIPITTIIITIAIIIVSHILLTMFIMITFSNNITGPAIYATSHCMSLQDV